MPTAIRPEPAPAAIVRMNAIPNGVTVASSGKKPEEFSAHRITVAVARRNRRKKGKRDVIQVKPTVGFTLPWAGADPCTRYKKQIRSPFPRGKGSGVRCDVS